jgi:isoleucyl-tRNA synthetase
MTDPVDTPAKDWRDTVFLPKTDFPMKAGLPQKEPGILARWQDQDIYRKLREDRRGRPKFILHDGPPYANGDMHIGHALNHILKDMVCRTQSLLGKDAPYVPGWDCHGLPIEWKVEEEYRKKKRNKDEVPVEEFRAECRAYAQHWVNVQREQVKRLGVLGNWDKPYLTMDFDSEATIVSELLKFAESGQLYRGAKPVMWSPVEKTALAEAEVEYEDITSTQIDVAFEITESLDESFASWLDVAKAEGGKVWAVIWTTTPWTIPINQALAYGPDITYVLAHVGRDYFVIAEELLNDTLERASKSPWLSRGSGWNISWVGKGSDLAGTIARHPMAKLFDSPLPFRGGAGGGECPPDSVGSDAALPTPTPPLKGRGLTLIPPHRSPSSFSAPAPSCPAILLPRTAAPGLSIWRPTMARMILTCARRTALNRYSRSRATANIALTGAGLAGKAASSTRLSILLRGRSCKICTKQMPCLHMATLITAIRIHGAPKPKSSIAAPRNGLWGWIGQ